MTPPNDLPIGFSDDLITRHLKKRLYRSMNDIWWNYGGYTVLIEAGRITDLASTPRWGWSFIPPNGDYAKATLLHDVLLENGMDRVLADAMLLVAMKLENVNFFTRNLMFAAVRLNSIYMDAKNYLSR
ncbi:MAG: DUF1353 domain-containing protein [Chloroflexota bacterium]